MQIYVSVSGNFAMPSALLFDPSILMLCAMISLLSSLVATARCATTSARRHSSTRRRQLITRALSTWMCERRPLTQELLHKGGVTFKRTATCIIVTIQNYCVDFDCQTISVLSGIFVYVNLTERLYYS